MSADLVAQYRDGLRAAAARQVRARERRRRTSITVAIVFSALFLVSGAVAAQQGHWLDTVSSPIQIHMRWGGHRARGWSDRITAVCVRRVRPVVRGTRISVTGHAAPCESIVVTGAEPAHRSGHK
ncbi:MAG: hypothetical protein H0X39_02405 [Actinobacteria bacterium]|nr:hypothetical protein [Actinomycetota bacterium]